MSVPKLWSGHIHINKIYFSSFEKFSKFHPIDWLTDKLTNRPLDKPRCAGNWLQWEYCIILQSKIECIIMRHPKSLKRCPSCDILKKPVFLYLLYPSYILLPSQTRTWVCLGTHCGVSKIPHKMKKKFLEYESMHIMIFGSKNYHIISYDP